MKIPEEVKNILIGLREAGFEAYIVGGCVRDLILDKTPKDWDVTTNATPQQIQQLFPESFYENEFGTVGIKTDSDDPRLKVVEVTTYRIESNYTDRRRPGSIEFASSLAEDLKRRDFTINALAMDEQGKIIDIFEGQQDLKDKLIRAVGEADDRFNEDALRMMRAIRLATEHGFDIEAKTFAALQRNHELLQHISSERIRDELLRIIQSDNAMQGVQLLADSGLMRYIIPELLEGVDVGQNKHHIYTVWEHNMLALKYSADQRYSNVVRMASLLHDVGKPRVKRGDGPDSTFYNHEIVGAKMTAKIMERLKFPKDMGDNITKLVRWHLFYYNVGEVTESSVRRLVAHIGKENVEDLIKVREADRIGSGVPKARPYKIRHLEFMIDKVSRDPISPKMLKLKGNDVMELLGLEPGPRVGMIINALMNEVLDDPEKNNRDYLEDRARQLHLLSDKELEGLKQEGKSKIAEAEEKEVSKIKRKHAVS